MQIVQYLYCQCQHSTPYVQIEILNSSHGVVGEARVYLFATRTRVYAEIHDVRVPEAFQGNGYGREVMESCLSFLREYATKHCTKISVRLTSEPRRIVANALYQKLNFTLLARTEGDTGTNLYGMEIIP